MRIKDMQRCLDEGTEVAVGKYYARRAVILALRQQRRVFSNARWDIGGHTAYDGVQIQYVEGPQPGDVNKDGRAVVGPTAVLDTWEAHQAAQRVKADREARREAERRQLISDAGRAIQDMGAGHMYTDRWSTISIRLTVEEAKRVADLITELRDKCVELQTYGPEDES